jgi:hypothetical protein
MKAIAFLTMVLLAFASSVSAQNVELNGYTFGMSKAEVLSRLEASGKVMPVKTSDRSGQSDTFVVTRNGSSATETVSFCKGLLHNYQMNLKGGFVAFVRQAERETERRGQGTYVVSSHETSEGQWNRVELSWAGEFKVGISKFGEGSEQVYVAILDRRPCR